MSLSSANCLNGTACSFLNCHVFMLVCRQLTKITFSVSQQIIKKKLMSQKLQFSDHSTFSLGFLTFFFCFFTSPSLSSCCSGLLFCDGLSVALFSCSWTCFTTEGELVLPVTTCCGATAAVGTVENNKSKMCWHTGNICLSLGQTVTSTILNYWSLIYKSTCTILITSQLQEDGSQSLCPNKWGNGWLLWRVEGRVWELAMQGC